MAYVFTPTGNLENDLKKINADAASTARPMSSDDFSKAVAAAIITDNNSILESGSNTNGRWIRFQDGTLIMMGFKTISYAGAGASTFGRID